MQWILSTDCLSPARLPIPPQGHLKLLIQFSNNSQNLQVSSSLRQLTNPPAFCRVVCHHSEKLITFQSLMGFGLRRLSLLSHTRLGISKNAELPKLVF